MIEKSNTDLMEGSVTSELIARGFGRDVLGLILAWREVEILQRFDDVLEQHDMDGGELKLTVAECEQIVESQNMTRCPRCRVLMIYHGGTWQIIDTKNESVYVDEYEMRKCIKCMRRVCPGCMLSPEMYVNICLDCTPRECGACMEPHAYWVMSEYDIKKSVLGDLFDGCFENSGNVEFGYDSSESEYSSDEYDPHFGPGVYYRATGDKHRNDPRWRTKVPMHNMEIIYRCDADYRCTYCGMNICRQMQKCLHCQQM